MYPQGVAGLFHGLLQESGEQMAGGTGTVVYTPAGHEVLPEAYHAWTQESQSIIINPVWRPARMPSDRLASRLGGERQKLHLPITSKLSLWPTSAMSMTAPLPFALMQAIKRSTTSTTCDWYRLWAWQGAVSSVVIGTSHKRRKVGASSRHEKRIPHVAG